MPCLSGLLIKIFAKYFLLAHKNFGALPIVIEVYIKPAFIILILKGFLCSLFNKPSEKIVNAAFAAP